MQTAYTVLILLMLVGVSRLLGRVIPLPLPLVQIAAGAVLAWPTLGLHVALDPELFLFLFLPPLLFSDGWRIPKREFWRLRGPILTLAVGLVLFTVVGAGYFIHWLLPTIPLPVAFALAAVLSPTDAVAVSAIAQSRLPAPLMHMLQGEALMNDATGLVTFKFALVAAITGVFSLANASVTFVLVACGGLAIGVALSWVVGRMRSWMIARGWDDPATHVVLKQGRAKCSPCRSRPRERGQCGGRQAQTRRHPALGPSLGRRLRWQCRIRRARAQRLPRSRPQLPARRLPRPHDRPAPRHKLGCPARLRPTPPHRQP